MRIFVHEDPFTQEISGPEVRKAFLVPERRSLEELYLAFLQNIQTCAGGVFLKQQPAFLKREGLCGRCYELAFFLIQVSEELNRRKKFDHGCCLGIQGKDAGIQMYRYITGQATAGPATQRLNA
jgi:hypothetical protein